MDYKLIYRLLQGDRKHPWRTLFIFLIVLACGIFAASYLRGCGDQMGRSRAHREGVPKKLAPGDESSNKREQPIEDLVYLLIANGLDWGVLPGHYIQLGSNPSKIAAAFMGGKPRKLHLAVVHTIPRTILSKFGLSLRVPKGIEIKASNGWQFVQERYDGGKQYYYGFHENISHGHGVATAEPLFLTFEKPALYEIAYELSASQINATWRSFLIHVEENVDGGRGDR